MAKKVMIEVDRGMTGVTVSIGNERSSTPIAGPQPLRATNILAKKVDVQELKKIIDEYAF